MTPADLPAEFPTTTAVDAGDAAFEEYATGADMVALGGGWTASLRAAVAADWPVLREAAIREAVAGLDFTDPGWNNLGHAALLRALLNARTPHA